MPVTDKVLSLVQLKVVVPEELLKFSGVMPDPEQIVCVKGVADIVAGGFTRTLAVCGAAVQLLADATMVKLTVTGVVPLLIKAPLILPVPLVAMPETDTGLSLVQLKVVPATPLVSATVEMVAPETCRLRKR
jgi:hypothetical protein